MNTNKLMADLRQLTRNAEDLIEATADNVTDTTKEARSRLRKALVSAKHSCEQLQDQAMAGVRVTDEVIREHPYQSIGVAFGVGLLVGVLALRYRSE